MHLLTFSVALSAIHLSLSKRFFCFHFSSFKLVKYETNTECQSLHIQNEEVDSAESPSNNNATRTSSASQSRQSSTDDHSTGSETAPTNLDSGLPAGWSMQMAPNGRMFFIDHNERKTSWVDPRTGRASNMPNQARKPEDDLGPLPEGWEERIHSDGRIFFIDHSTGGNYIWEMFRK